MIFIHRKQHFLPSTSHPQAPQRQSRGTKKAESSFPGLLFCKTLASLKENEGGECQHFVDGSLETVLTYFFIEGAQKKHSILKLKGRVPEFYESDICHMRCHWERCISHHQELFHLMKFNSVHLKNRRWRSVPPAKMAGYWQCCGKQRKSWLALSTQTQEPWALSGGVPHAADSTRGWRTNDTFPVSLHDWSAKGCRSFHW